MRVLFQQAIQHGDTAVDILDSIATYAEDCATTDTPYPAEELEWICTTAFNRAVDFYCASDDRNCQYWAAKAISIAHSCPDGGVLEALLQERFLGLSWDVD